MEEHNISITLCLATIGFLGTAIELYRANREEQAEQEKKRVNLARMDDLLCAEYSRCREFDTPAKHSDLLRGIHIADRLLWEKEIPEREYQQVRIITERYGLNNRKTHYLWRAVKNE